MKDTEYDIKTELLLLSILCGVFVCMACIYLNAHKASRKRPI